MNRQTKPHGSNQRSERGRLTKAQQKMLMQLELRRMRQQYHLLVERGRWSGRLDWQ
jgi:hypothetical protein